MPERRRRVPARFGPFHVTWGRTATGTKPSTVRNELEIKKQKIVNNQAEGKQRTELTEQVPVSAEIKKPVERSQAIQEAELEEIREAARACEREGELEEQGHGKTEEHIQQTEDTHGKTEGLEGDIAILLAKVNSHTVSPETSQGAENQEGEIQEPTQQTEAIVDMVVEETLETARACERGVELEQGYGETEEHLQQTEDRERETERVEGGWLVKGRLSLGRKPKKYFISDEEIHRRRGQEGFSFSTFLAYLKLPRGSTREEYPGLWGAPRLKKKTCFTPLSEMEANAVVYDLNKVVSPSGLYKAMMEGVNVNGNFRDQMELIKANVEKLPEELPVNVVTHGFVKNIAKFFCDFIAPKEHVSIEETLSVEAQA